MILFEKLIFITLYIKSKMEDIKAKKFFVLGDDKENYDLSITLKNDIIEFYAQNNNDISGLFYKSEFSHDKLCQYTIFKLYKDTKEDFDKFFNKYNSEKITINFENKNLCVNFIYQIFDTSEIAQIVLTPQKIKVEEATYLLSKKNKEIEELRKRVSELEKENEMYKKNENIGLTLCQKFLEINDIGKKLEKFEKENELLKQKMEFLLGYEYILDADFDELKRLYEEMRKTSTIIGILKI